MSYGEIEQELSKEEKREKERKELEELDKMLVEMKGNEQANSSLR